MEGSGNLEECDATKDSLEVTENSETHDGSREHLEENEDKEVTEMAEEHEETEVVESKPKPKPKRGGSRRSRKRRGGSRSYTSTAQVSVNTKEASEIQPPDEGEIEVTKAESVNEGNGAKEHSEGEETHEKEPSPIMTRRSNRKLQQIKEQQSRKTDTEDEEPPMEIEEPGENVVDQLADPPVPMDFDGCDVESVKSEFDSVASDSTLTTRSRRRVGQDNHSQGPKRKGQQSKPMSRKGSANGATGSTKGKSRRIIFKKSATKAPTSVARAITSDRIYYKGQYFTRGDIVSVEDIDGSVFYAQLRGFLTDQYCEKSGVITWLLPTVNSPPPEEEFDPSTYVIGPEEDLPRRLEYFTFVMHAPDDYFFYKKAPYPTSAIQTDQEYLLTRLGPKVRMIKAGKPIYQDHIPPLIPV